jgi:hypothetical protein
LVAGHSASTNDLAPRLGQQSIETDATKQDTLDTAAYPCTPLTSCNLHHSLPNSSARETTLRHSANTVGNSESETQIPLKTTTSTCPAIFFQQEVRKLTRRASTSTSCRPRDRHPHSKLAPKQENQPHVAYTMHRDYITLRALVVQLLLLVLLQTSLVVGAEEPSPSTTITTTSTTVVSTKWVVITSSAGSLFTYTTSAFATGSTVGITTVAGSTVESTQASSQTPAPTGGKMAWQGQGFKDAVLNSTNQYRAQHEASAVKWNQTLASYAQDHADSCEFKHTVIFL